MEAAGRCFILLLVSSMAVVFMGSEVRAAGEEAKVPAIFIFGDSTFDVGTNNFIPESKARADFPPNGIDFPYSVATGRFSNGFNTADQLARLFGYKRSPSPFLSLLSRSSSFKKNILLGANFASGGSGIFDGTGSHQFVKVVSLRAQVNQFSVVRSNLADLIGAAETESLLSKSLFLVSIGSNDIFDFALANGSLSSPLEYVRNLHQNYSNQLKNLYGLGARKFGVVGVPPIGCCPVARRHNKTGGCMDELNGLVEFVNRGIEELLKQLSSELQGMKYAYGNSYEMTMTIIQDPFTFGIQDIKTACCGGGTFNGKDPCNQTASFCMNRHERLFWDQFHPTQVASQLAALTLYGGSNRFVTPMNFSQLAN